MKYDRPCKFHQLFKNWLDIAVTTMKTDVMILEWTEPKANVNVAYTSAWFLGESKRFQIKTGKADLQKAHAVFIKMYIIF